MLLIQQQEGSHIAGNGKAVRPQRHRRGSKRPLVISSMRRNENILLRQTLLNWFSEQLTEISFRLPTEVDDDCLDEHDIFLTTEKRGCFTTPDSLFTSISSPPSSIC